MSALIGMPQGAEWLIILAIVILVFGAAKLPDLARGTGQALRIFKAETKGLKDDDKPAAPPVPNGELNRVDPVVPVVPVVPVDDVAEGEIVDEHREKNA
jgi:sec-independent protein translocase protein TatA